MIDSDRLVRFSRAEQNFLLFYVYFNCILYVFRKWKRPEKTKKKPRKKEGKIVDRKEFGVWRQSEIQSADTSTTAYSLYRFLTVNRE